MRYETLIIQPVQEMIGQVTSFIPTLLVSLLILIGGGLVAHLLSRAIHELLKVVEFDKFSDKVGIGKMLKKGGIKHGFSEVLGSFVYWVTMIMTIILTVKSLGLTMASHLVDTVLGYIPSVISGVLVLFIGMLLARVVSAIVYVTAKNTKMPIPGTLSRLSKYAIVIYVTVIFLQEIGFGGLFMGTNFTIFFTGIVFALALSFGLAGRDIAHHYLKELDVRKTDR